MMDKKQCKVKVIIRVRPPLCGTDKPCVNVNNNSIQIFNHRNVTENIQYDFSAVFGMESSQQQIYTDSVKRLLPNALNGQNVSIFAYGPTGAGKTHTMLGTPSNPGVIPRVINGLFQQIEEEKKTEGNEWKYKVSFSYLEIYNEKVQDLLEPSNADLPIREDADKNILIPGLAKKEIHNFDDFSLAFGPASNNRTVAATKLNNHSSRSHSIVQLTVTKSKPCRKLHGKIYLIDLAGSEDNRRTGNKGIRLKESGAINKSLFALGEVVDAINCGLPRIPYRNSKLTRLLQDSVGGSCHSLMITNIAPEERYYYDTYCTLNFATKSKKIVNNTVIKETVGIVKPQPQVRKVPPCPRLSDEVTKVKRPRLLDSSSDSLSEEPMPSLSPLMKRQTQLEENVNRRLEELESNLIKQMTSFKPGMQSGDQTPKTKAIQEMQRQLEASHAQLKAIASRHMLPLPSEPPALPASVPAIITQSQVLKDKTNSLPAPELYKAKKGRPLGGIKRKKEEEFTCSPLFAPPPRVFKKGFTSSATCSSLKDSSMDEEIKAKKQKSNISNSVPFNSVSQQNRNEEFLTVINTSSIKDLQSLQTVGAKRAKLIFEWRETYGLFTQAEDLKKIPGFTEKYLEKLLHSNLITVT